MSQGLSLPRFKRMLRKAVAYEEDQPYWRGFHAALRLVAVDLGYSHAEIDGWINEQP